MSKSNASTGEHPIVSLAAKEEEEKPHRRPSPTISGPEVAYDAKRGQLTLRLRWPHFTIGGLLVALTSFGGSRLSDIYHSPDKQASLERKVDKMQKSIDKILAKLGVEKPASEPSDEEP